MISKLEWRNARALAYAAGEYVMRPPDVTTGGWDIIAWCNWVRFNDAALRGFDDRTDEPLRVYPSPTIPGILTEEQIALLRRAKMKDQITRRKLVEMMRVQYRIWKGTPNAEQILDNMCHYMAGIMSLNQTGRIKFLDECREVISDTP